MVKSIPLFLLFFCFAANAKLQEAIDDCYATASSTLEASKCADSEIASAVRQLNRRISELENGTGGSNPDQEYTVLHRCTDGSDPILYKTVIANSGQILREDNLKTFTDGDDDQERQDCQAAMVSKDNSLGHGMSTLCKCDKSSDPRLILELINRQFQTVATQTLNTFTAGDDPEEARQCQQMIVDYPLCH